MPRLKATLALLSLATAFVPATLAAQSTYRAVPGSLQFVQGQANIDGQPLSASTGLTTQPRQLHAGETLATANGSADLLLAPGALLRIGSDTTVRLIAADANRTEVRLDRGLANVSVNVVRKDRLLLVDLDNGQTQLVSRGLYTFNTAADTLRVFNGEANVFPGADTATDVKPIKVKEGHEIILGGDRAKPAGFDRETADEDLLPWSGPRESQAALADATVPRDTGSGYNNAGYYPGAYGFSGYGYGYGDPFFAGGSPYGFGYPYGPYGFYGYPFFGVGFGFYGGGYGGGYYGGGSPFRGPVRGPWRGPVHEGYGGGGFGNRGGYGGHAFAGGGRSFGGGGFHGGGGHR